MDDKWGEKFTLICKPEQSGKTWVMIQEIIKAMKEELFDAKTEFWNPSTDATTGAGRKTTS